MVMAQSRREFLNCCAAGGVGLYAALARAAERHGGGPLAPRAGHHPARAKQLLFVYLTGGFSQLDTFDPKPKLNKDAGKTVTATDLRGVGKEALLASPFKFTPCGKSGLMVSELFPHLGTVADELCVVRSLHTDIVEHFQASLAMHTGSATVPMPSLGAWLSMGLGTFNPNLPAYVVLCEHLPYAGAQLWDHSFIPPLHQGVRVVPGPEPIPDLKPTAGSVTLHELEQMMLRDVNERHAKERGDGGELRARINSFDTATGMMHEAPAVFDLAQEQATTLADYGVQRGDQQSFGWQCLVARRLLERGARVVELIDTGASDNWDAHGNMQDHRPKAKRVDRPLAALIRDLKRRGMLEQTLVVICTEFGRTPWVNNAGGYGRNHYAKAFTSLLAGAGVRGGMTYGSTDEHGIAITEDACHVHDYHATILHLMGIDHEKLTYRYAGRDFRLTDVAGKVMSKVLI
jgi:hypothetical protein